jgi:propionyl-CoA carboxylase alpha chain
MGLIESADEAVRIASEIGFPVMIKASAGGGGKGMRIAWSEAEVREGFQASKNEAASSFGDDRIFIEKFVTQPRHIEIQVLGDTHEKVIEEAPSPFLDEATRRAMGAQAVALAKAVDYHSAGTVEFIVDGERNFYFLEMNTRLQVEHPVTELVTGIDLVEQMIRVAAGERLPLAQEAVRLEGWALESRLYAEDPYRNFLPSIGRLTRYRPPRETEGYLPGTAPGAAGEAVVRNDTGVEEGGEISRFYDPMIAKLCSWAPDRAGALEVMREALDAFEVEGIGHNLPFLATVMDHPKFVAGRMTTAFIAEEFAEGFSGAALEEETLRALAVTAVAMRLVVEERAARISGAMTHHERAVGAEWTVGIAGNGWPAETEMGDGLVVVLDGRRMGVSLDWLPGQTVARAEVDGRAMTVKTDVMTEGVRLRYRGADLPVTVRSRRTAELAGLMPVKEAPDTSKMLLCPMPGVVVSIAVQEGQTVEEGQPLCIVEAMKMENLLRAERKARVKAINAAPGQSLGVDEVIMEFD